MRCYLVVAWDGNVHVFQWRVSIAEGNNWDVYVGSLSNRLVVSSGVSHNQQARFSEGSLKYLNFNKVISIQHHSFFESSPLF